ncbi:MAG: glycosyltransferase family 2 protein [Deltaproteobacteria bacterium]|nr:glycosyltransferase family 2 protein [Nannocystaceae bacterium]
MTRPQATSVIPARNEAATIAEVVRGCLAQPGIAEVIVVDDASTDGTATAATAAGATVLRSETPLGKGAAMRLGMAHARGDTIVLLDGDGQDPPGDIPRLLAALEHGAELAIGSRFLGTFEPGAITAVDRFGNRALSRVLDRLYGVALTDTQAGFRAIRRTLLERLELRARHFEIETELLVRSLQAGATVVEVPVSRRPRRAGTSRLRRIPDGLRILGCMLWLRRAGPASVAIVRPSPR